MATYTEPRAIAAPAPILLAQWGRALSAAELKAFVEKAAPKVKQSP